METVDGAGNCLFWSFWTFHAFKTTGNNMRPCANRKEILKSACKKGGVYGAEHRNHWLTII
jgi:hypothetical protein